MLVAAPSLAPDGRIEGLLMLTALFIDSCLFMAYCCYLLCPGEVVVLYSSAFAVLVTLGAFANLVVVVDEGATLNSEFSNFDLTRSFEVDLFP